MHDYCTSDCRRNGCEHIEQKELEDAKAYIGLGISEGFFDEEQFADMDDEELITFYKENGKKGDLAAYADYIASDYS